MVTGASTADAVLILIDASKVKSDQNGNVELLIQTKRHSTIAHLLNIKHVVVAINKMDLIHFDEKFFNSIVDTYKKFADQLGLSNLNFIPISALSGDNVVVQSEKMPWYKGTTLIELLENLDIYDEYYEEPLRFPVQLVARHNGHHSVDFRGYMGRIEAGKVTKGDKLVVQPNGHSATVEDIQVLEGSLASAAVGQSVTILLKEYIDISRGDMFTSSDRSPLLLKIFDADICWLSEEPLDMRRKYSLKHTTKQVTAYITKINSLLDINTQEQQPAEGLKLNDIGHITLKVQQPLVADTYNHIRSTGSFILIDEVSHQTAAVGMIRNAVH